VRFASDLCKYFAETVVPAWADANGEYETNRLGFLTVAAPAGQAPFVVQNGEFVSHHFDLQRIAAEAPKAKLALKYLNVLEAFAIPFAEGVADENIGFRETARPFCQGAQLYMPFLFFLRSQNLGRFESIVKLYTIWTNRLAADAVAPLMQVMQQLAKGGEARIKPLDHGF